MTYNIQTLSAIKRTWLLHNSNIPSRFMGYEPQDIIDDIGEWADEISEWIADALDGKIIKRIGGLKDTGVGLLFDGAPGRGKTTHAVVAAMEFVRQLPDDVEQTRDILKIKAQDFGSHFRPIYYQTFPDFLSKKKALMSADGDERYRLHHELEGLHGRAKDDTLNVRVLILDDLGKEYGSKYDDTSFDELLRARYDRALPTIVTTNVPRDRWAAQYGDAMGSFVREAFTRVQLDTADLRKR